MNIDVTIKIFQNFAVSPAGGVRNGENSLYKNLFGDRGEVRGFAPHLTKGLSPLEFLKRK